MARIKKHLSLVLALAVVLIMISTSVAMAQDKPANQSRTSLQQLYLEKLAGVLGIDQAQLQTAMKSAGQQALDTAVAQGLIDSTRAANLKKALDSGRWPWPVGKVELWHKDWAKAIASALGLTPQQLHQEIKNGKTMEQLATARGLTLEQLKSQVVNSVKSQLEQAVAGGKLTQDKADQILNRLEQLDLSKFLQPRSK
ncbi:hypothetical protein MTBGP_13100 [Moorella thermoacetica]|uniref:hypothetical protein n=1 Tax=Neomoorella thermoacetica TaxID=1525 RepID=UPI0030CA9F49